METWKPPILNGSFGENCPGQHQDPTVVTHLSTCGGCGSCSPRAVWEPRSPQGPVSLVTTSLQYRGFVSSWAYVCFSPVSARYRLGMVDIRLYPTETQQLSLPLGHRKTWRSHYPSMATRRLGTSTEFGDQKCDLPLLLVWNNFSNVNQNYI